MLPMRLSVNSWGMKSPGGWAGGLTMTTPAPCQRLQAPKSEQSPSALDLIVCPLQIPMLMS
jgi:hypothetical protein